MTFAGLLVISSRRIRRLTSSSRPSSEYSARKQIAVSCPLTAGSRATRPRYQSSAFFTTRCSRCLCVCLPPPTRNIPATVEIRERERSHTRITQRAEDCAHGAPNSFSGSDCSPAASRDRPSGGSPRRHSDFRNDQDSRRQHAVCLRIRRRRRGRMRALRAEDSPSRRSFDCVEGRAGRRKERG